MNGTQTVAGRLLQIAPIVEGTSSAARQNYTITPNEGSSKSYYHDALGRISGVTELGIQQQITGYDA